MNKDLENKICKKCFRNLPKTTEFYFETERSLDRCSSYCKDCTLKNRKTKITEDIHKIIPRERKRKIDHIKYDTKSDEYKFSVYLKCVYNITYEEYLNLLETQNGKCAICKIKEDDYILNHSRHKRFCVDHNHTTGEVRGLLCDKCNSAIGLLNEDLEILNSAINYLNQNSLKYFWKV